MVRLWWHAPLINLFMGRGLTCFHIGVLIGILYNNKEKFYYERIGYIGIAINIIISMLVYHYGYDLFGDTLLSLTFGLFPLFIISILFVPVLNKIFANKLFIRLGKLSMIIFLWHFPIQCLWRVIDEYLELHIDYGNIFVWGEYILSVLVFAHIYNIFLEKWLNKLVYLLVKESKRK